MGESLIIYQSATNLISFKRHVLTFVWLERAVYDNEVTVVVNC